MAFVAYGATVGGARSVEQLRLVSIELQMAPISEAVYIPMIWAWAVSDENNKSLEALIESLIWWAKALKSAREKS